MVQKVGGYETFCATSVDARAFRSGRSVFAAPTGPSKYRYANAPALGHRIVAMDWANSAGDLAV